jgi:hypothetical protein
METQGRIPHKSCARKGHVRQRLLYVEHGSCQVCHVHQVHGCQLELHVGLADGEGCTLKTARATTAHSATIMHSMQWAKAGQGGSHVSKQQAASSKQQGTYSFTAAGLLPIWPWRSTKEPYASTFEGFTAKAFVKNF